MDISNMLPNEVVKEVKSQQRSKEIKKYLKEYDPAQHNVHDERVRPKKLIKKDVDGRTIDAQVDVARISMPFQRIIVNRAAAFLVGDGIKLVHEGDEGKAITEAVKALWHETKMDYKSREVARILFSETEVAELWHMHKRPDGKVKVSMQPLSYSNGDSLYPYFDEYGDMTAFGRGYKVDKTEHLDIYTSDATLSFVKNTAGWSEPTLTKNPIGKIPIVYYEQDEPEWRPVQPAIERFETLVSNFADANDYFASPMIKVRGNVTGFASKGEQGKLIQMEADADASYLTWDQAPEAIRLEVNMLQELIMSMTQTPDISFNQMKGIGAVSGTALKIMFMDAQLKSKLHQETFSEGVQRRINILKAIAIKLDAKLSGQKDAVIWPEFMFPMPDSDIEAIELLQRARGVGDRLISKRTALQYNPLVMDADAEMALIRDEDAADYGRLLPQELIEP